MKFEFGDLYKFIVSLGVILISISVLGPWLFLKEPFDLFKTEVELKAVTNVARAAIQYRQEYVLLFLKMIPWFSSIGVLCGLLLGLFGLTKWRKNQLLLDKQTFIELELKKQGLREATKDEVEEKVAKEFVNVGGVEGAVVGGSAFFEFKAQHTRIEELVTERLRTIYGASYDIQQNMMLGGTEIDILLKGKTILAKDFIVEIKSIRKGINYAWLREAFLKIIYAKTLYTQINNRIPNTLLLMVTDSDSGDTKAYEQLVDQIRQEKLGRMGKDTIVVISKEEISNLDPRLLQERLGVYA